MRRFETIGVLLGLGGGLAAQVGIDAPGQNNTNIDIITQAVTEHSEVKLETSELAAGDSGAWWAGDGEQPSKEQAGGRGNGCVGLGGVSLMVQRGGGDAGTLPRFIVVRDDIGVAEYEYHGLNSTGTEWIEMIPGAGALSSPGVFSVTDAFAVVEEGSTTRLFSDALGWSVVALSGHVRVGAQGCLAEAFYSSSEILGVSSLFGSPETTTGFAGPVQYLAPLPAATSAVTFRTDTHELRIFSAYQNAWTVVTTATALAGVAHGENLIVVADGAQTLLYSSFTGNVTVVGAAVTPSIAASCAAWIDGGVGHVYRPLDDTVHTLAAPTALLQAGEWAGFRKGTAIHLMSAQIRSVGFAVLDLTGQTEVGNSSGLTNFAVATDTTLHGYSSYSNQWGSTPCPLRVELVQAEAQLAIVRASALGDVTPPSGLGALTLAPLPSPNATRRRIYAFSPRETSWSSTETTVTAAWSDERVVLARSGNVFSAFGTESRRFMSLTVSGAVGDWGVEKAYGYVRTASWLHAFSSITDRWYSTPINTSNPSFARNGRMLLMREPGVLTQFRAMSDLQPARDWGTGRIPAVRQLYGPGAIVTIEAFGPPNALHTLVFGTARAAVPLTLPAVGGFLEVEPSGLVSLPLGTFSPEGTNTISLPLPPVPFTPSVFYLQSLSVDGGISQLGQLLPLTVH